jgi:Ca2+-transporting ATPase
MAKVSKIEKPFYQLSPEESVVRLGTDAKKGLTEREAKGRLAKHGPNTLAEGKRRPLCFQFLDQFKDLMIMVLIVASLLSFYLKDNRGGIILLVIVVVNAIVGFVQEYKAEKILERLRQIVRAKATVIRDGVRREIEQSELVPGDLVFLDEGNAIPADIRLTEAVNFSTNDFILTGESVPQEKFADLVIEKDATVTNQDNLVFLGITVARGNAHGVVVATGMETAIGQMAKTTQSIERDLSPLQREIDHVAKALTKIAGIIALSLFVLNFLLSFGKGQALGDTIQLSILFAIGVAAACVPQGLPAQVSVALSLGVGRMARRNAVVRKLSAVETLGSTTVICSDKTGTITKNEMTITHCYVNGRELEVSGQGYEPKGAILEGGKKMSAKALEGLRGFFADGFLASNGRVNPPDHEHRGWYAIGDPTEAAFTPFATKAGLDTKTLEKRFPMVAELPFDSVRKRMTVVRRHKGKSIGYMKGGLEEVLSVCAHVNHEGEVLALTEKVRKSILAEGGRYASQALRVIALAYRDFPSDFGKHSIAKTEREFVFAGFVAMIDPPRIGVKEAVQAAYDAHIRVMMITGDNAVTASAIAKRIGMRNGDGPIQVISGDQLGRKRDPELRKILQAQSVIFSRVSPDDKFRLVGLLKKMGEVVAVTGDGVNDTLSLKKSDIGVAMGRMGSEVAKEASEIVLLDDNFRTLIVAISEGRTLFNNLKKTILSTITSNNGELFCVLLGFVGVAFGLPAPITAVQILAVDLIGEMLPLTALTFDPAEKEVLQDRPRNLKEHILDKKNLLSLFFYGFWMGASGFFSFVMVYKVGGSSLEAGHAAAYCGIILAQWVNILSLRTEQTIFTRYLFANRQLWGSFLVSILAVLTMIYVKSVSVWFGFGPMSLHDWGYPAMGAILILALHEGRKLLKGF